MMRHQQHTIEWFENRSIPEPNTGCMLWLGRQTAKGYGRYKKDKKGFLAHRGVFEAVIGPIPDGLLVCHRCDMPSCVNPEHLFLGSNLENMQDMTAKGRGNIGERNGRARLTEGQVLEIRASPLGIRPLAIKHNLPLSTVGDIKRGKTWRELLK